MKSHQVRIPLTSVLLPSHYTYTVWISTKITLQPPTHNANTLIVKQHDKKTAYRFYIFIPNQYPFETAQEILQTNISEAQSPVWQECTASKSSETHSPRVTAIMKVV